MVHAVELHDRLEFLGNGGGETHNFFSCSHWGPTKFSGQAHWPGCRQIPLFLHDGIQTAVTSLCNRYFNHNNFQLLSRITFTRWNFLPFRVLDGPFAIHTADIQGRFAIRKQIVTQASGLTWIWQQCTSHGGIYRLLWSFRARLWAWIGAMSFSTIWITWLVFQLIHCFEIFWTSVRHFSTILFN